MLRKPTLAGSGTRLVITGLGTVSPLGNDTLSTWNALVEGRSGVGQITHFDTSKLDVKIAAEVKDFDASVRITPKEQRRMDRFIQLGLYAAFEAIEQSAFKEHYAPERVGMLLSSGIGGLEGIEIAHNAYLAEKQRISPFFIPSVITNLLPGQVSLYFGFRGPNYCISSACSSSAHAVGEGMRMLERGDIDVAIVGGAEAPITPLGVGGFAAMKALSKRNEAPAKASRPFDVDRDGFIIGEGASILVVERWESAQKRGAPIFAELIGYGTNSDAYHLTAPSENGEGAANCMRLALQDAGLSADKMSYINMHGTSTRAGDIAESCAVESVFGRDVHVSSTKSMTGHLLGAAGAFEIMVSALALKNQVVPPTINLDNQDPECRLDYTPHRARKAELNYALSNSFGFGGTNVSVILKKYSSNA